MSRLESNLKLFNNTFGGKGRAQFPEDRCKMRIAAIIQFVLAALLGIIGVWCVMFIVPWAFVGNGPPDYLGAALFSSPLAVAVILFLTGLVTLLKKPKQSTLAEAERRAEVAEAEVARLRAELDHGPTGQTQGGETGIQKRL